MSLRANCASILYLQLNTLYLPSNHHRGLHCKQSYVQRRKGRGTNFRELGYLEIDLETKVLGSISRGLRTGFYAQLQCLGSLSCDLDISIEIVGSIGMVTLGITDLINNKNILIRRRRDELLSKPPKTNLSCVAQFWSDMKLSLGKVSGKITIACMI